MSDIQTSVYGYVRRPALQVLLKDAPKADATSPTRVSMTGAKKAEEGAGGGLMGWGDLLKGAKAEKDEEGDRAQAAPAADTSAVMTEQVRPSRRSAPPLLPQVPTQEQNLRQRHVRALTVVVSGERREHRRCWT